MDGRRSRELLTVLTPARREGQRCAPASKGKGPKVSSRQQRGEEGAGDKQGLVTVLTPRPASKGGKGRG